MIFVVSKNQVPKLPVCTSIFTDASWNEWKVSWFDKGFFLEFLGEAIQMPKKIDVLLKNYKFIFLKCTGVFQIENLELDFFIVVRNIILEYDSPSIFDILSTYFSDRLSANTYLREGEIYTL